MAWTLNGVVRYQQSIKKSQFDAIATPVNDIAQAQAFLAGQRDASLSHQCWAWKINGQSRVNDDGEPSGTAGRPMLAVIEGQQLDNVLVLVNRVYGGVKLGTGGLARAYGGTVAQCLALAEKRPLRQMQAVAFFCDYALWQMVAYALRQFELNEQQLSYIDDGVQVSAQLAVDQVAPLKTQLQALSKGQIVLIDK